MRNFATRTKGIAGDDSVTKDVANSVSGDSDLEPGEPLASRHVVFAVVSMALFMASIDATIVATALHSIDTGLHAHINWSAWTITIYSLGRVTGLPSMGKVGEQFGRKKVFLISVTLFTVSSLFCGLSVNIYMLVVLRFIQAVGGSAFMPSATSIVSDQFGRNRDRAIGMFSSILPIGGVIGPILGGIFVTYWSWRGIFLVNVPIGIILIVLAVKYIPDSAPKTAKPLDVRGIVLMSTLILSTMFGITALGSGNTEVYDVKFLLPEILAIGLGIAFIRHIKRDESPVIPMSLLKGRGFATVNIVNILFGAAALGFGALVPLYAQNRYHISVIDSGTLLIARSLGMVAVAGLATLALRKTGYRKPMIMGFTLAALGMTLMSISPWTLSPYAWLAVAASVTGLGMGLVAPSAANAGMQIDPKFVGAIAGLRGTFRNIGSIMSISITTAIIARSATPGVTQGHVFIVFAIVLAGLLPMVFLIPDHRGTW